MNNCVTMLQYEDGDPLKQILNWIGLETSHHEGLNLDLHLFDEKNFLSQPSSGTLYRRLSLDHAGNTSRVTSVMNGWNVQFDGTNRDITAENFIYRVRIIASENLGGDMQLVVDNIYLLLKHRALEWYWRSCSRTHSLTWQVIVPDLIN